MSTAARETTAREPLQLSHKTRRKLAYLVIGIVLFVYAVVTILPFYFLFVRSFVSTRESVELWMWIPPRQDVNMSAQIGSYVTNFSINLKHMKSELGISGYVNPNLSLEAMAEQYGVAVEAVRDYFRPYVNFSGWMLVFTEPRFMRATMATVGVVAVSLVVGGLLSAMTGSVLSSFRTRWHGAIYRLYIMEMIIPAIMILLPLYVLMTRHLNLRNSYLSLVLIFIKGGAVPTLLFTSFIQTIPKELMESVYVDGGNRHHYFFRILLPLTKPAFAAFVAMRVPRYWNDLIYGFVFLSPDKYTLVPLITSLSGEFTTNFQALYSGLCLSILPLLILYLIFNKLFLKAQLAGALKG